MTKFNFLLDQIKTADVKGVLTVLQTAKSKLIQVKFHQKLSFEHFHILAMENSRYQNNRCR